jgi:polysaccharide biosynthesis protein PslE
MNAEPPTNLRESKHFVESGQVKITWSDLSSFLQIYWPLICGIFFSTVITTYLVVSFLTDRYEVTTKLLVRLGREQLQPPPTVSTGSNFSSLTLRKEDVTSEIQILQSPDLVTQVVDVVGVENFKQKPVPPASFLGRIKFYLKQSVRKLKEMGNEVLIVVSLKKRLGDREQAIAWLLQSVYLIPERESDVISVQFRTPDPEVGVQILSAWIDLYLQRRLQVRQNTGVKEFLETEVKESREQLEQVELQKRQWKQSHLLSESKEQVALLLRQISDLSAEQSQTLREAETLNREIERSKALIAASQRNLPTKREESPNPILAKLREELTNLQIERSKLFTKFQERSEPVQNVEEQIARVAQLIEKENATQVFATYELNPLVSSVEQRLSERSIQLGGLKGKTEVQKQQRDKLEEELRTLADADAKLAEIERERQIAEQKYLEIVKRKQEADVAAALDLQRISNVSVLTPPISSIEPVSPRRLMMMGLSAVLGLLLGFGLSLLLKYLDDRVGQPTQLVELTGLPHLGTISSGQELAVTRLAHDRSATNI